MEKILTGNHSLLKNLNSKGILNLIRTIAPISGYNLAKIAGMRLSAVHDILINKEKKYAVGSQTVNMNEFQLHYLLKALEFGNGTAVRFFHKRGKIVGDEN